MSVRKTLTAAFAAAVATSAVTMIASPAHAVYNPHPEDSKATPVAADLIGGGSDTTMLSLFHAAELWNDGAKADYGQTFDVASFAAVPQPEGGTIKLPTNGDQNRPNGSSDGKAKLQSDANYTDLDFARSSDRIGGTGKEAEGEALEGIPFALDTVAMAVSKSTASHAPASLTLDQLKKIYTCEITNWSEVGGTAGTIKPYVPQSGSGTEKFFKAQIGGAYGEACVKDKVGETPIQEHTDGPVKNDADAIVPISKGRAELLGGTTIRLIDGIAFDRAVYNVVRAADISRADIQAFFGEDGFLCSAAAADAIAQGGLTQLATPENGGVCGTAADTTSNFATNEVVTSATTLTGTVQGANVQLVAKVAGSSQPTGTVSFFEGETLLKESVPVVSGQATFVVPSVTAGAHTYQAVFTPNNAKFLGSEASVTVTYATPAPPVTGPSAACTDATAKAAQAQAKVKKLKAKAKKAKGAKKKKATAKVKKAKKAMKAAKQSAAASC